MTHYFARPRRARGAWYEALLTNQAETSGTSPQDLTDFDEIVRTGSAPYALIAADSPAPARGYALLPIVTSEAVYARIHVLPGQPDDVYRALFSQARVHADQLAHRAHGSAALPIRVDADALAEHVADAINRLGEPYLIEINPADALTADDLHINLPQGDNPISEETARQLVEQRTITVENTDGTKVTATPDETAEDEQQTDTIPTSFDDLTPAGATSDHPDGPTADEEPQDDQSDHQDDNTPQEDNDTETTVDGSTEIPTTDDEHPCPEPGCDRTFTSARGLTLHSKSHQ